MKISNTNLKITDTTTLRKCDANSKKGGQMSHESAAHRLLFRISVKLRYELNIVDQVDIAASRTKNSCASSQMLARRKGEGGKTASHES